MSCLRTDFTNLMARSPGHTVRLELWVSRAPLEPECLATWLVPEEDLFSFFIGFTDLENLLMGIYDPSQAYWTRDGELVDQQ